MRGSVRVLALIGAMIFAVVAPASAQKSGGVLKLYHRDSPGSLSIHEEATISAVAPAMGLFNNLVLFNQHEKQNRPEFNAHASLLKLPPLKIIFWAATPAPGLRPLV